MDLILNRKEYRPDGIFGEMKAPGGEFSCFTLEHAYGGINGYTAKIPPGTYDCVRGLHHLFKVPNQFETFEVVDVPGHTSLLIHPGNYDNDSDGCILVGNKITQLGFGAQMLANSKITFAVFMKLQAGLNSFKITVNA